MCRTLCLRTFLCQNIYQSLSSEWKILTHVLGFIGVIAFKLIFGFHFFLLSTKGIVEATGDIGEKQMIGDWKLPAPSSSFQRTKFKFH